MRFPKKYAELNSLMLCERAQKVCVDANVAPVAPIIWRLRREGTKELVKCVAERLGAFLEQGRQLADHALLSEIKGLRQRILEGSQKVVSERGKLLHGDAGDDEVVRDAAAHAKHPLAVAIPPDHV